MRTEEEVLRLAVRRILKEEGEGGDGGHGFGDFAGMSGMGGFYGPTWIKPEHLKAMVAAFAAPFQLLYAGSQKALVHTETLAQVGFEAVMTTIVPFLTDDFDKIFKKRDEKIKQINDKYAPIKKAIWESLGTDALVTAFCMAPAVFLTSKFVTKAPRAALEFLKYTAGGVDVVDNALSTFNGWFKTARSELLRGLTRMRRSRQWDLSQESRATVGRILSEDKDAVDPREELRSSAGKKILDIMQDPEVRKAVFESKKVKSMQKDASAVMLASLDDVVRSAHNALQKTSSIEGLDQMSGGKIGSALQKAQQEIRSSASQKNDDKKGKVTDQDVERQERKSVDDVLVSSSRDMVKSLYTKMLMKHLDQQLKSGIPADHPYIDAIKKTVDKIKAL